MARPTTISDQDVDRCAGLYSCGGLIEALAETYGVSPSTLRRRIKARCGGRLPARLSKPACTGALSDAAQLLELLAAATDSDRVARAAAACRDAIANADRQWGTIGAVGSGKVPPPAAGV